MYFRLLKDYLKGQLLLVFVNFLIFWTVLHWLNVRFAFWLGLMTGIFSLVPTLGVLCAALIVFFVSVFDGQSYFLFHPVIEGFIILLVYFLFNQVIDFFISPLIIGRATKLPAVVVFLTVITATYLFGLAGAILAVPFVILVKALSKPESKIDNNRQLG